MELTKVEFVAIEATILDAAAEQAKELSDLELMLVGGGHGDIILG